MSEGKTKTNSKKRFCAEEAVVGKVEATRVVKSATKPKAKSAKRLDAVYLVLTCEKPVSKVKEGEQVGHETQDTEVLGVFSNLKDANREAKLEAFFDEENDGDNDDEEEADDAGDKDLFDWQEEPSEWTARRVWVEKKQVQY